MTPVEMIANWTERKSLWWRLALKITLQNGGVTDENIQFLFEIAQSEHGLLPKPPNYDSLITPIDITGFASEEHPVQLTSACPKTLIP